MRLSNILIFRITLFFTIIMLLWGGIYLLLQMHEIHDSIDDGLVNLRQEFVVKANREPGFIESIKEHSPFNLIIKEISMEEAVLIFEHFETTKIYFATEREEAEVRMLTSAFRCELNDRYYQIQFFTATVERDDLIENILYLTFALWCMLIITLIIVSKMVISRANKPFFQLLDQLKDFRLDNSKTITLPPTKIAEYVQLNDAIRELISKNINIFTEQKEFIENCSHELQTPLAVVGAKLELLIQKYQSDPTHIQEITEISDILSRMKRLNFSLLLISKIKNNQFVDLQIVNLNDELKKILNELSDFIEYKKIAVDFENREPIEKKMNVDLAHVLFTNLLKNAITHNEQGGTIHIVCAGNQIIIANSGVAEIKNIFSRYNNNSKNQANVNSSGLGLSIAKSIVDLYQIDIEYRFEEKKHIFILRF